MECCILFLVNYFAQYFVKKKSHFPVILLYFHIFRTSRKCSRALATVLQCFTWGNLLGQVAGLVLKHGPMGRVRNQLGQVPKHRPMGWVRNSLDWVRSIFTKHTRGSGQQLIGLGQVMKHRPMVRSGQVLIWIGSVHETQTHGSGQELIGSGRV